MVIWYGFYFIAILLQQLRISPFDSSYMLGYGRAVQGYFLLEKQGILSIVLLLFEVFLWASAYFGVLATFIMFISYTRKLQMQI